LSHNLTIVIPIFNDRESLEVLTQKIEAIKDPHFQFLIVDNGSTDLGAISLIKNGGKNWSGIRTPKNLGFGGGILYGINKADTFWVGWMPGNLKIDPLDIPEFVSKIVFSWNVVTKAKRVGRPLIPSLKTLFAGIIQSTILQTKMIDTGGTPTVCTKDFILGLKSPPKDYVFESFILFKARNAGLTVQRLKINYGKRMFGQSHWQSGFLAELQLMQKIISSSGSWR